MVTVFIHLMTNRSGTPNINGSGTVPQVQPTGTVLPSSPPPPSALSGSQTLPAKDKSLEASVIDSIEVDLGDF